MSEKDRRNGESFPSNWHARIRFVVFGGRLAKEFRIIPQTFVLPHEFNQFVAAFTSSGKLVCFAVQVIVSRVKLIQSRLSLTQMSTIFRFAGRLKGNHQPEDSGSPNGPGLSNPEDHLAEEKMNNDKGNRKAVWIMKPVGMSRGRGIRLIDDIKNISYADKVRYSGWQTIVKSLRIFNCVTDLSILAQMVSKLYSCQGPSEPTILHQMNVG